MDMRRLIDLMEGEVLNELAFEQFQGAATFTDWSEFKARLDAISGEPITSEQDLCARMGIDFQFYDKIIDHAVGYWRDSTSRSLFNGLANHNGIPQAGTQVFPNLFIQTQFLTVVRDDLKIRGITVFQRRPGARIDDDNAYLKVDDGRVALTVQKSKLPEFNHILQVIYLYEWFNGHKQQGLKLPRFIYRGIRSGDLFSHDNFKEVVDDIWKQDASYEMKRKQAMDRLFDYIIENGLDHLSHSRLLSFTSFIPTAKYFSNGNGFILRVDPRKVQIVTSELHDAPRMGGKDMITGRSEREYIVRLPEHYPWTRQDIIINDIDYFLAEMNPLCVGLFHNHDREASYEMSGVPVKAKFRWNTSGTNGSVRFRNGEDWEALGRAEFKKRYGVDPLPTETNLGEVTNFKVYRVKSW